MKEKGMAFGGKRKEMGGRENKERGEEGALEMRKEGGGGKETVRNTFRRKRQAAQNAMKIAFRGTCRLCA